MKNAYKPVVVESLHINGKDFEFFDCVTGAHRWPSAELALLCCNGWIAKWVPKNSIPEEALCYLPTNADGGVNPNPQLLDLKSRQVLQQALLAEDSPILNDFKTVPSRLEEKRFKTLEDFRAINLQSEQMGKLPLSFIDFVCFGAVGVKEFGEGTLRYDYFSVLFDYFFVLVEKGQSFFWSDPNMVTAFIEQNNWPEWLPEIPGQNEPRPGPAKKLLTVLEVYHRWRKASEILQKEGSKAETN